MDYALASLPLTYILFWRVIANLHLSASSSSHWFQLLALFVVYFARAIGVLIWYFGHLVDCWLFFFNVCLPPGTTLAEHFSCPDKVWCLGQQVQPQQHQTGLTLHMPRRTNAINSGQAVQLAGISSRHIELMFYNNMQGYNWEQDKLKQSLIVTTKLEFSSLLCHGHYAYQVILFIMIFLCFKQYPI